MNITIIGSGWLALPLAQHLNHHGHNTTVTTTRLDKIQLINAHEIKAVTYHIGDVLPASLTKSDVIVMANTCKDTDAYQVMVNHILNQWSHRSEDLPQFIYTSTTGVYQDNGAYHNEASQALNINHPTMLIEQALKPLNANIIRLAGLVGPSLIANTRHPGRFFRKTKTIKNPENKVNLIHSIDAIGLIETLITLQSQSQTINACADNHPTKGEYYSHMAKQLDGTNLIAAEQTTSAGKTIDNIKSKKIYTYRYPDVWKMTF